MEPILTFDIGVASVGWTVIDSETKKIIESCSAIFSEANPSQNKDRRQNRGAKRMSRRKTNRINDFRKLWTAYSFSVPEINPTDIVDLKVKGLSEEITLDELFAVLKNYLKHRGISYLDEAELKADESGEKQKSKGNAYARGLQINEEALRTKYP